MSGLTRDSELRLAPEIRLTILRDELFAEAGSGVYRAHANLLEVLRVFQSPTTFGAALAQLVTRSRLDWMDLSAEIVRLHRSGILVSHVGGAPAHHPRGFGSARVHVEMLDDVARTRTYLAAVRAAVRPGDVVVDLGTGTGVLAIAAAQAGARHVYAIERSAIADVAQEMFEANGVADRVSLLRQLSTQVELPERANVMVSEIVGNDPFDEQILAYTRDALARLLAPSARLVPEGLRVFAQAVKVSPDVSEEYLFESDSAAYWTATYGFDFSSLARARPRHPLEAMIRRDRVRRFETIGPRVEIARVDLRDPPSAVESRFELSAGEPSIIDGIVIHFEIDLGGGHHVANDPWGDNGATSWGIPVWLFPTARSLDGSDPLVARYRFTGARASVELESTPVATQSS